MKIIIDPGENSLTQKTLEKDSDKPRTREFFRAKMSFRIVGFIHPEQEISKIYRNCRNEDELIEAILWAIDQGCNLFSIRGFKQ